MPGNFLKTAVTKRNAVLKIFFTAFLAYFLSESMLRQAAVAKVTAKGLSVDSIIMKLPESIRSTVKKHIEISRLQDDLKNAETEAAKIRALINLANASGDKMELSRTLAQIMQNYPDNPASAPAYRFFFRHASDKANRISISEMQRFILILPEKDRISMWEFGTNRLRETGAGNNEIIDFSQSLAGYLS